MAALAGDLSRQILSHSDAARAFRPWWDNLEDSLMYSLVIMGEFQLIPLIRVPSLRIFLLLPKMLTSTYNSKLFCSFPNFTWSSLSFISQIVKIVYPKDDNLGRCRAGSH